MRNSLRCLLAGALLAGLGVCLATARAAPGGVLASSLDYDCASDRELVAIGHDATLEAGKTACDVVSVLGDATVNGTVTDSAVAVLGDLTVNGSVANNAVSVFGDNSINGPVDGNAVSVFGDMRLGPKADIEGQVVNVFGSLIRDPAAVIHGGNVNVVAGLFHGAHGLQAWTKHCMLLGRLLAPRLDLGWAWSFAAAVLLFYLLLAALFREGLQRCVQTLDDHPGPSFLAALAMVLLTPILPLALVLTVIGVFVIPLFWLALLCAGIFGRVVALGWLGGRIARGVHGGLAHPLLHVLIGGLLALVLYTVPVLGFLVYAAIGFIGFGAVMYTLLIALRSRRGAAPQAGASIGAEPGPELGPEPAPESGPETATGAAARAATAAPTDWTTLPRAGFWIRIAALLIDVVLIGFVLRLIGHRGLPGTLLVLAGYGAVMWRLRGTTVGGIICNLRVARIDGQPISWETAVLRALGCFLSLVAAGLGFFWIAFDPERQAWHDKIAGTVVVLAPKAGGRM